MNTHLTPTNETVVREREDAMRLAHERAATTFRARIGAADTLDADDTIDAGDAADAGTLTTQDAPASVRSGRAGGDVVVITLFAVLASGLVSLVVTRLRI
ncbi:MAG: hypothetical protein JWL76_2233 [Thermoleophilia bacterium]|nr:hypothetical protein [Thermoleophilia bacterium]